MITLLLFTFLYILLIATPIQILAIAFINAIDPPETEPWPFLIVIFLLTVGVGLIFGYIYLLGAHDDMVRSLF